jgi:hypothetical protein
MQNLTKAWREYKTHPQGFEKLAHIKNKYIDYFVGL